MTCGPFDKLPPSLKLRRDKAGGQFDKLTAGRLVIHQNSNRVVYLVPFNAAERSGWTRTKVTHCLSPDLSGRVCGTSAGNRCARAAEGQVEGGLSFASFSLAVKGLFSRRMPQNEEGNWISSAMVGCGTTGQWSLRYIFEVGSSGKRQLQVCRMRGVQACSLLSCHSLSGKLPFRSLPGEHELFLI